MTGVTTAFFVLFEDGYLLLLSTTMLIEHHERPSQPLPPKPPKEFIPGSPPYDAYEQCLILERMEGWAEFVGDLSKGFSKSIVADMFPKTVARILGYALRFAPNTDGRDVLAREIVDCRTELDAYVTSVDWLVDVLTHESRICSPELLTGLAHLYVYGMIHVCEYQHLSRHRNQM